LPKRKRTKKKGQPITWPRFAWLPSLLAKNGRHRDDAPFGRYDRVAFPFFAALLGCVKRHKKHSVVGPHSVPLSIAAGDGKVTLKLSEAQPSFLVSRQLREAQGSPKGRYSWGALFVFLFGQAKRNM